MIDESRIVGHPAFHLHDCRGTWCRPFRPLRPIRLAERRSLVSAPNTTVGPGEEVMGRWACFAVARGLRAG
jgi:hypothetical protein